MNIWRLCHAQFVDAAFDGVGAKKVGGRWNSKGTPIVYTSESLSQAALELLVHIDITEIPPDFIAIYASIPDEFISAQYTLKDMPADWQRVIGNRTLQQWGDAWQLSGKSIAMRVPSVVIPEEHNILLNPEHPEFRANLTIIKTRPFEFDYRLS